MAVFQELNEQEKLTIVLVTHEPDIADYAKRIIHFRDGHVTRDQLVAKRRMAAEVLAGLPPAEV
jgi:putative ABC transport system ATP-binding protein